MKKIIAAFDGLKYSGSTREYSIYLSNQTNTYLVGIFLDDPVYKSYNVYDLVVSENKTPEQLSEYAAKDEQTRSEAAINFEEACQNNQLEYSIHHDKNIAIQELKHESIYADLLVIDSSETLTHYPEKLPTRFIRDLLSDVQCPVVLVPQQYKPLQKLILLYDGEPSAVHAIKMFSYLLPQLKELDTEVISVKPVAGSLHLPDKKLMKEFMKRHYPKAKYTVLAGLPEVEIVQHLAKVKENAIVVLGAYRRGPVSRWFRESMADVLMKELKLPLFIAHNK